MAMPPTIPPGPLMVSTYAAVEQFIASQIPEGKRGALVGVVNAEGTTFALAARINNAWVLAGDVSRRWDGEVSGRVYVARSW
jgi:hypothetical protein